MVKVKTDMNILLISYGDIDYDGRLRSLISVFEKLGKVFSYTRGKKPLNENSIVCKESYSTFIIHAIRFAKSIKDVNILVLDNRKATIPGLIIKRIINPDCVIQDCRELYLHNEVHHLAGKIGCFFEKSMAKKSDIVICANEERAVIMRKEYGLQYLPVTYENLRKLEYSSEAVVKQLSAKFASYIDDDEIRIISSSGCSVKRTNDVLVRNLNKVNRKCRLFLVGASEENDEQVIKTLAAKEINNTITIFGQLNQDELKYLISQCHIGIVNYGQYDTNNRLCASGKLYEFLYEGKPVVTTTNPPLKRLCEKEKIGCADDLYYRGINEVLDHYDYFTNKVNAFANKYTIAENDNHLLNDLLERINKN